MTDENQRVAPSTVSVVIPTYQRPDSLERLLASLSEVTYAPIEVIVVDGSGGETGLSPLVEQYGGRLVETEGERFSSYCRNLGAAHASGRYLLFVDDDNVVPGGTVTRLVRTFEDERFRGLLGPLMLEHATGDVWCSGGVYHRWTGKTEHIVDVENRPAVIDCDYVPNAYMMRRETFVELRGLDHRNFPQGMEEVDLGHRLRTHDYRVAVDRRATVRHDFPSRRGRPDRPNRALDKGRSRANFYRKHQSWRLALLFMDVGYYTLKSFNYSIPPGEAAQLSADYLRGVTEALMRT